VYVVSEGCVPISFFHDIPLKASQGYYNMYVEIGVGMTAKMEMIKDVTLNPIMQDVKNGTLRFNPAFPFIYGAFPQTWEDPSHIFLNGSGGDNDPLDCVVLGSCTASTGSILQVKVIGAYAMIDNDEMDWKVIAINAFDPFAQFINDEVSLEKYYPGVLNVTFTYLSTYKPHLPQFAYQGQLLSSAVAIDVLDVQHSLWRSLNAYTARANGVNLTNTQLSNAYTVSVWTSRDIMFGSS
jgi:inorganic pyrophosphatase